MQLVYRILWLSVKEEIVLGSSKSGFLLIGDASANTSIMI
jgi:hypothetical protein